MIKKIIALLLAVSMAMPLMSFNVLAEGETSEETAETLMTKEEAEEPEVSEENDYAEIVFGDEVTTRNIKNWYYISGGTITEFEGKQASLFKQIGVDVDDDFLYNVEEGEEIWITIDYFGYNEVYANIQYETFTATGMYTASKGFVKHTQHSISANETWQTYTYKLTDYKGANGVEGNLDFRLTNWIHNQGTQGKNGDMAIHSVRIERRPWTSPLRMDGIRATFDSVGNMYSPEDELILNIPMKNVSEDSEMRVDWTVEIYNDNDVLVDTADYSCELAPGEVRTDAVPIPNPVKKGVYWLRPVSRTSVMTENGWGEPVDDDEWEKTDFSISFIFDKNSLNYNVGINSHSKGDNYVFAELIPKIGIGWTRQGNYVGFTGKDGDKYTFDGSTMDKQLKAYKDNGMKVMWEIRPQLYDDNHFLGLSLYGRLYGGTLPRNATEISHFAKYHGDAAEWLAPYVDDFEIFNEPDLASPQVGGKQWGLITKPTAAAIRKSAPNATVSGPTAADEISFLRDPFAESGALDSLDTYTYHVYDWSGDFDVWNIGYVYAQDIRNYLREYGKDDMPIWCTETGYIQQDMRKTGNKNGQKSWYSGTYPDGMPRHVAARLVTLETAAFAGFDIVDKWFWHIAVDFEDATEREDSFGIFNTYTEKSTHDYTPYTAKPTAVALAATNYFINGNTESKHVYGTDDPTEGVWGFHFYNPDLKKDVLLLQTQEGMSVDKAFNLGCESVEIFDLYGNSLGTMKSDDGVYTFHATQEAYYIVGNFGCFAAAEKTPKVSAVELISDGVKSDIVTATVHKNTEEPLTVEVERLEVVSNEGFDEDGNAKVSYQLPDWDYKRVYGTIKVLDSEGNLVFVAPLEGRINDPVSVTWEPIKLSENSDSRWGIKATVKNHAQTVAIDGEVTIESPSFVADINETRRFDGLKATKSVTYIFKLEEMIEKEFIDLVATVKLDNGYKKKYEEAIDFTTAKYAYTKPVIDGVQSPGEWNSSKIGVKNPDKFSSQTKSLIEKQWSGPEDFSYSMQLMWDEENFYFLGVVVDDIQYNAASKNTQGAWALWQGDSIQIAMSDEEEINSMLTQSFAEIGLGLETETNEVWTYIWNLRYEKERIDQPLQNSEAAVVHYDGYTVYELRVPWSELFYEGYVLDSSKKFRIAVLGNESDGDSRMALEYGNGVADDKDATKFARIQFVK